MSPPTWIRLASLSVCLIVLPLALGWGEDAKKGKKYALLVGVTEYDNATSPVLKYTGNDVEELRRDAHRQAAASTR